MKKQRLLELAGITEAVTNPTSVIVTFTDSEGWTHYAWGPFNNRGQAEKFIKALEQTTGVSRHDMSDASEPIMIIQVGTPDPRSAAEDLGFE